MSLTSPDFESGAYTNFATPAVAVKIINRVIAESQTEEAAPCRPMTAPLAVGALFPTKQPA